MSQLNRFNRALHLAIQFLHQVEAAEEHEQAAGGALKALQCVAFCYAWSDELVMHAGQAKCDPERVGLAYVNELLGQTDADTLELIDREPLDNEAALVNRGFDEAADDVPGFEFKSTPTSERAQVVVRALDSFLERRSFAAARENDPHASSDMRKTAAAEFREAWNTLAARLDQLTNQGDGEAWYVVIHKGELPRVRKLHRETMEKLRNDPYTRGDGEVSGPFESEQAAHNYIDSRLSE